MEELTWIYICSCKEVQKGNLHLCIFSMNRANLCMLELGRGAEAVRQIFVVFTLNIEMPLHLIEVIKIFVYSFQINRFKENYLLNHVDATFLQAPIAVVFPKLRFI